jgi:hypothetical protein
LLSFSIEDENVVVTNSFVEFPLNNKKVSNDVHLEVTSHGNNRALVEEVLVRRRNL